MGTYAGREKPGVSRVSISLPESLQLQLDQMVEQRGYGSRSRAIAEMITLQLTEYLAETGEEIMAGTITLVYDHSVPGLQKELADIQHEHINEVISSLHVYLAKPRIMEVLLVQGPAAVLQQILDRLVTRRGVISGKLQLTSTIMPPLHPLPEMAAAKQKEMNE